MAETFSIDGMALNTNNNFPLKDGHPILSTWRLNPSDNDQQFDRQGQSLRHRSTGKCLNAYQPSVGSIVNVYPCKSNDGDQKFDIEGSMSTRGNHWAETSFPNSVTPRQRQTLSSPYHATMKFRRSFLDSPNSNQLTRLTTHELGHALYLDEGVNDSLLRLNGYGIMEIYPLNPTINEGVYRRLESLGYSVNRNPSLQW